MDDGTILFHFSDRVSAFDVQMATPIPRKGEVLCRFAEFWFRSLDTPNHMIRVEDRNRMVVKRLSMIPIECVVRGYYYGSLVDRYMAGRVASMPQDYTPVLADELPHPIFDPTTKSEQHDLPIDKEYAISNSLLSESEFEYLRHNSISIYLKMKARAREAGFIMADVKLEFGWDSEGRILLGDSLGPDEFRLWPLETYRPGTRQESFDKQLLRDWLITQGFKTEVDRLAIEGKKPPAPTLPNSLVSELAQRYRVAYERITGESL